MIRRLSSITMPKACNNKMNSFLVVVFLFLSAISEIVTGQSIPMADSIKEKIRLYSLQNPSATLFVHFDKNVYANNEHAWFTAYLLKNNTTAVHHTLGVGLMRNDDRSILTEGKFRIENGLAFGNLILPDSLPPGNYTFICYTDHVINGNPSALFPITTKSSKTDDFVVELILRDSINAGIDSAKVLVRAYKQDLSVVSKAAVNYFIGERTSPLLKGKIVTDKIGEAEIKIPLKQINGANNILQTEVSNGTDVKTFSLKLPVYKKETSVKFYPEGGNLVAGVQNLAGWEVKNNEGESLMVKAGLFENDKRISTVYTDANGIGKFNITPQLGNRYYVKFDDMTNNDSVYVLPSLLQDAPVLSIKNALASDTLIVELTKPKAGEQWVILIHNYHDSYLDFSIPSASKRINLKIALDEVPKGLNAITLIDASGRPWSERIFFAHYDKKNDVKISTDTSFYTTRQKVKLHIKIADAQHKPVKAVFSIASVQANRLDPKKMIDIESYFYLKNDLSSFPYRSKIMTDDVENKEYLETVLLVKGWRKYLWQDVEKATASDTIQKNDSLTFTGYVLKNNKPLKRPIQIIATNVIDSKISALDGFTTDSTGRFILPMDMIEDLSLKGVIKLAVLNEDKLLYKIILNDPYKDMNRMLASHVQLENTRLFIASHSSRADLLPAGEVVRKMAAVIIKARKDNSIYWSKGANVCGDYVCMYNVLNCINHPPGTNGTHAPVVGGRYRVFGGETTYNGCSELWKGKNKDYETTVDGIRTPMEFYVDDLSKKELSDPQYLSTIYWNHAVVTDGNGEASLEFYTGDIAGRFRIVLQGVTNNDVLYGEQFFEVVK
jgi:hypothetical protein